ncbi:MAG: hypothetical protein Q7K65_03355 [Candidatus Buchananbacteria bacterium]|nr:hypothetical protein [Candidatus Buchananbacteria bacterium]
MKCQAPGCGGIIDESKERLIPTPCAGNMAVHPCEKCGLLHLAINGNELINRPSDQMVFLRNGLTVLAGGQEIDLNTNLPH